MPGLFLFKRILLQINNFDIPGARNRRKESYSQLFYLRRVIIASPIIKMFILTMVNKIRYFMSRVSFSFSLRFLLSFFVDA